MEALKGFKSLVKNPEGLASLAAQHTSQKSTHPTEPLNDAAKNSPPANQSQEPTASSFNTSKKITREEATKTAQDVMSAFYTSMFKSMFSEIAGEDESFNYGMTKELFVEQMAKSLGRQHSPTHEHLINAMMRHQENVEDAPPEHDTAMNEPQDLAATVKQTVDNQETLPLTMQTAAQAWPLLAPPQEYWGGYTPKIREAVHVLA